MRKKYRIDLSQDKEWTAQLAKLSSTDVKAICLELCRLASEMEETLGSPVSLEQAVYYLTIGEGL